ncbi:MAG: class I SAM-dependent methyltransferase [Kofleriaceae bacterium]
MATRVTIQIYSGRPDPSWDLDPVAERELVRRVGALAPAAAAPAPAPGLGYRGFAVVSGDLELQVCGDRVSMAGRALADPTASVEAWLLATSPLDRELRAQILPRRDVGAPKPFAHYDQRNYPTFSVADGYARWAPSYDSVDDRLDLDLLDASPRLGLLVVNARVVDLGCGTGRVGAWLHAHRARELIGVDLSSAMLERATARGFYARTIQAPITTTGLATGAFDGAISCMVLDHVTDLAGFFTEAHRLVRPGGWLAIVDFHPFFMMRGVPTHFADGEAQVAIENHVHPLRDFFKLATGFTVVEFEERYVTDEWALAVPGYRKHVGLPVTHAWLYQRDAW